MNIQAVGIDIAKQKFDVAMNIKGHIKHKIFANNKMGFAACTVWLKTHAKTPIHTCMEATGVYGEALAKHLHAAGHQVSVVNPLRIKKFGECMFARNKTDKADAQLIAAYCEKINPPLWQPKSAETETLDELEGRLEALKGDRQREVSRLERAQKATRPSIDRMIKILDAEITKLQKAIKHHIDTHERLKKNRDLLVTIPGIGEETASKLIAVLPDVEQFEDARQLSAFAGLCPRQHESGSSVRKRTGLNRLGRRDLRKMLYFPAIVAAQHNPDMTAFCERLRQKGKVGLQVVCAAMNKLLRTVYGVLKSQKPFVASVAVATT